MAIKNISEIEQSLGIEAGKLKEKINDEKEHTVDLSDLVIKSKTDHETLITNTKKESGKAAVEIAVKTARKDNELEFEGKTMKNLLESFKTKVETDAKVAPNKKYDLLKVDFDKRGELLTDSQGKFTELETSIKQERQVREVDNKLLAEIPDNITIPKGDVLAILRSKHKFNIGEDGMEIMGNDGKPMKTENLDLLAPKDFMVDFIKPYLKPVEGGGGEGEGEGDDTPGGYDAFEKEMETKNITGEALNEEMSKRIEAGTLKM